MKTRIFYFITVLMMVSILPATAQEAGSLITIDTDKASYVEGETIVISGQVATVIVNTTLTMQIFYQGNVIDVAQFDVAQDGSFTHTVIAEGPLWGNEGEYLVRAHYGGDISEATLEFSTKKDRPPTSDIFEVDAGSSGTFDVEYTINGGTVENMVIDPNIFGLQIMLNTTDDGTISISLPRNSIDAKTMDGNDEKFIVLIERPDQDGEVGDIEIDHKETKNNGSRILTITFEEGDSGLKIIGTQVVPEFGTIMTFILLMGIATVIILTKNKFPMRI